MSHRLVNLALVAALFVGFSSTGANAASPKVERGKYLVTVAGCNDCHTPGYLHGDADMSRYLAGSDVAFEMPGLGAFVGPNLTPDDETGIGKWSEKDIVTALKTGTTPDGRILAPVMPWHAFAHFTDEDVKSIAAYLKTLEPIYHRIPAPFGPGQKVTTLMYRILPPGETVAAAAPEKK